MNNEGINGVFIMKERMLNTCKNIVFLVCMFCCVAPNLQGQVQQGIVRTALRPNRDSVRIPGVSIRQRGNSNMVVSDSNGVFDILLTGVKIGDPFYLSSVRKMGYELMDDGIIGKAFPFSPGVPVEVVMLDIQEKEEDKQRIIDNAYQQAEKEYKSRCAFLEKQLEEESLSEDKYREELQKLQSDYEGFEALISPMAERYASMDYASIDNLNMEISIAIEEGNLEKADSLISTAGSLADKVKQSQEAMDNVRQRKELGREIIEKAEKDSVDIKRNNEYLADLLYSKYCICLSMFESDSAVYYIQLRANLDTTNAEWQIDAGWFVGQYLADYEQALILFQRALRNALRQYGENNLIVAVIYNNIGSVYREQSDYVQAIKYFKHALEIKKTFLEGSHPAVATSYNNIGSVYFAQGDYVQALEYYQKALEVQRDYWGENHISVAAVYNNMGGVFFNQGDYGQALTYYQTALGIQEKLVGVNHPDVALSYNNIGSVYHNTSVNFYRKI